MSYAQLLDYQRFVQICYILYTFYNKLLLSICYILVYKKLLNETFPHTKGTTTRRKPPKITNKHRISIFGHFGVFWKILVNGLGILTAFV